MRTAKQQITVKAEIKRYTRTDSVSPLGWSAYWIGRIRVKYIGGEYTESTMIIRDNPDSAAEDASELRLKRLAELADCR